LSTFIWCTGFKFGAGPKNFWMSGTEWPQDLRDRIRQHVAQWGGAVYHGKQTPFELRTWIENERILVAHNAGFERTMLNGHCGKMLQFPETPISQWICTAAKARAHGLPGALGEVCAALGTHPKSDAGRGVMLQVCRPKKASKKDPSTMYTPASAPDKFWELALYNLDDVEAEYGVDMAVPDLSPNEQRVWELDQRIKDLGVMTDLAFVADAQYLINQYKDEMRAKCLEWTGLSPTQSGKLAEWVRANGWPDLPNLQAETVAKLTTDKSAVPQNVKRVLKLYNTYGMKAVSKFDTFPEAACSDGRVRGMFIYHGAGTGRWSSVLIQLQNMARGVIDDVMVAIEIIKERSLSWLRAMYQ
jgi:DNA polymerase